VTVNSKEENSSDFCLDFVQEFGLCSAVMCKIWTIIRDIHFKFYSNYVANQSNIWRKKIMEDMLFKLCKTLINTRRIPELQKNSLTSGVVDFSTKLKGQLRESVCWSNIFAAYASSRTFKFLSNKPNYCNLCRRLVWKILSVVSTKTHCTVKYICFTVMTSIE
jgi:hypothetical protein